MKTRPGEVLIDCLDSIEDTKGNNGDRGHRDQRVIAGIPPIAFVVVRSTSNSSDDHLLFYLMHQLSKAEEDVEAMMIKDCHA